MMKRLIKHQQSTETASRNERMPPIFDKNDERAKQTQKLVENEICTESK